MSVRQAAIAALLILALPAVSALAQGPPAIFIDVSPMTQDAPAGGTAEYNVAVYGQGSWQSGRATFTLKNIPEGVDAVFEPETIQFTAEATTALKITVSPAAPQGPVTLTVIGQGVEERTGARVESSMTVTLNIGAPTQQNTTTTTRSETMIITSTVTTTATTTSTHTVTIINTEISREATPLPPQQASGDPALLVAVFGAVAILLAIAFITLRHQ